MDELVIVGAGVAGLSCAETLRRQGIRAPVLERARGVGGRCATRRVDGQPVDHGLCFLHGRDPEFLAALDAVPGATPVPGWPGVIAGTGAPCQPRAFAPEERRLAFVEGLSAFPKHLASRLDVRLGQRVKGLEVRAGAVRLQIGDGTLVQARSVVLAVAVEQARALLASMPEPAPSIRSATALLRMLGSVSCWTVLAGYPVAGPAPRWEMLYPETSEAIQLVSHDSSKRRKPGERILVIQALPRWSRRQLEDPTEKVTGELVEEAGRLIGPWAARPSWTQAHRWRYARTDGGTELSQPLLLPAGGGSYVGIAGEAFQPGGGVEGAWISGVRMAQRLSRT